MNNHHINIIFPHQLFEKSPLPLEQGKVILIEEELFFNQYHFHKQKLAFHRASMKFYESFLKERGYDVQYISATEKLADIRKLVATLGENETQTIHFIDPTDDWLEKRLKRSAEKAGITLKKYDSPLFLNTRENLNYFLKPDTKKFFQTRFYIDQRKERQILLEEEGKPLGEKWSFDAENRKKYPRKKLPPVIHYPSGDSFYEEACEYVGHHFPNNYGVLHKYPLYPYTFKDSRKWLERFLSDRFHEFGPYEDAIVASQSILHHSVLTPMLNVGLISPEEVVESVLEYAKTHYIPLNSTEGFIRQIIGWREFIRGIYEVKGVEERTRNFWGFTRKIPESFWHGETGIFPVDVTIKKVLQTGYCHHIERLMVLGNFMVLCEFDPDEVYRWFMELFIDSYDWVMVPNVYGMSQFADGGLMSTKPYISGSNYLIKMSDYPKGDWQEIWDGLFWRFMHVHRDFFQQNPRLGMLVGTFDKMDREKKEEHLAVAERYLGSLG